jgi:hypothetical protein
MSSLIGIGGEITLVDSPKDVGKANFKSFFAQFQIVELGDSASALIGDGHPKNSRS